jgi:hypothetical protein
MLYASCQECLGARGTKHMMLMNTELLYLLLEWWEQSLVLKRVLLVTDMVLSTSNMACPSGKVWCMHCAVTLHHSMPGRYVSTFC